MNGEEEISHREPKEILEEIEELNHVLTKVEAEMRQKIDKDL